MWTARTSVRTARRQMRRGPQANRPSQPADSALRRLRGGFGIELHDVGDANGSLLGALVGAGQNHESTGFETLIDTVPVRVEHGYCLSLKHSLSLGLAVGRIAVFVQCLVKFKGLQCTSKYGTCAQTYRVL